MIMKTDLLLLIYESQITPEILFQDPATLVKFVSELQQVLKNDYGFSQKVIEWWKLFPF